MEPSIVSQTLITTRRIKMKRYIKKNWMPLLFAFICSVLASVFAVKVQFLKGDVLDYALSNNIDNTLRFGLYLGAFIILELGFFYLYDRSKGRFTINSIREVRFDYFQSILSRHYPDFLKQKQGEYIAQYTNEMDLVENCYFAVIPLLAEILIKILMVSIFLFFLDYRIAIITLVLLTTPLYIPKLVEKKLQHSQEEFVDQFATHIRVITDWLRGFEVIKNFSIENTIRRKFAESNDTTNESKLKKKQMSYLTRTISASLSYFSHFIILTFAAYLVLIGDFSAGDFFVAVGMIDQLSYPIISLSNFIQDLISVEPVNKSILEFIHTESEKHGSIEIHSEDFQKIEFDNVSFAYDGQAPILQHFDMEMREGKQYLLKGASGSGKTTSMNLLLGYYEPSSGAIKINDVPVKEISNLNKLVTVMRQDAILFEDTLRNNLTMYRNIADDKVIATLSKVGLDNYASSGKLDELIHEGGTNLSGGEKRRVALVRSLLRETPILILDEPLANLDEENSKSIESELLSITDRTVIIISHQFSEDKLTQLDKVMEFK